MRNFSTFFLRFSDESSAKPAAKYVTCTLRFENAAMFLRLHFGNAKHFINTLGISVRNILIFDPYPVHL